VLSLGTGEPTRQIRYDQDTDWGLAMWAQPLISVVFDGVSDAVDYHLRDLCEDEVTRVSHYERYQVTLTEGNDDLDDTSRTNVKVLKLLAENLIDLKDSDLKRLCDSLVR
jgi:uncharacterized protein